MKIKIEPFDPKRHPNPMGYIDQTQDKRYWRAPSLSDYQVCLVQVCGFIFFFHSTEQLGLCLDFYRREHHPSSRLPVYTENLGGDHWETQRWFEKLPQYLLEKPKRRKVVQALERALIEYSKVPSSTSGTEIKPPYQ
jgi:hypothetical protein